MKALITGITGFVGIHLARELQDHGIDVCGTYFPENSKSLFHSLCPSIPLYLCDIRRKNSLKKILKTGQPDIIFHLAAMSSVKYSFDNPHNSFMTNATGTLNLFDSCASLKLAAKIILISSSDVYGNVPARNLPVTEKRKINLISPYAVSKYSAEMIARYYFSHTLLTGVIVRPFNHIGPYQAPSFVLPSFAARLNRIAAGEAPPVMEVGDISVRRDVTDVRDIVRAYRLVACSRLKHSVYNIASGRNLAISQLLDKLIRIKGLSGIKKIPNKKLYRQSEIRANAGDTTRLFKETEWKPRIPLKKTLTDILNYYR